MNARPTFSFSVIEKDFPIDLKHSKAKLLDYSRFIRNGEDAILLEQIEKNVDLIESLPDHSSSSDAQRFSRLESLCQPLILPSREIVDQTDSEDQLLLVESIIRSHLTHLRAISSFPRFHLTASSSLIDEFLSREHQHLLADQEELSLRMEQLLEILPTSDMSVFRSNDFIRSILYDRSALINTFVNNYGAALEYLSKATATDVNLKFIRRRGALIRLLRLEQAREQEEELIFQVTTISVPPFNFTRQSFRWQAMRNPATMLRFLFRVFIPPWTKISNPFWSIWLKVLLLLLLLSQSSWYPSRGTGRRPSPTFQLFTLIVWFFSHWINLIFNRTIIRTLPFRPVFVFERILRWINITHSSRNASLLISPNEIHDSTKTSFILSFSLYCQLLEKNGTKPMHWCSSHKLIHPSPELRIYHLRL